jgi:uncharacterized protein YvpB
MGLVGVRLGHLNSFRVSGQTRSVEPSIRQTATVLKQSNGTVTSPNAQIPAPGKVLPYSGNSVGSGNPAVPKALPASVVLQVPPQDQLPEFKNGCEVTSLSMLLTAVGHPVSKGDLAREQPHDSTPLVLGPHGTVQFWGNPNVGFVGSVSDFGYGIYHGPLSKLLNQILPGRAEDLTGKPFTEDLAAVASGRPVVVWTTSTFEPTNDWVTWQSPEGPVHATWEEHAVLLVGYDATHLYVNNPLTGQAAEPVNRDDFLAAWKQLGQQALTVTPAQGNSGMQDTRGLNGGGN